MREFWELDTLRPCGWMFGSIPVERIRSRGRELRLVGGVLELFVAVIREMDRGWLEWQAAQEAQRRKEKE